MKDKNDAKKLEHELEEGYQAYAEQHRRDAEFFLPAQAEAVLAGEKAAVSEEKNPPRSPDDPRPGNRPHYIAPCCPDCGTPLELLDLLENPEIPEDEIWHDEFICPKCREGIRLDWPESELKKVFDRE